MRPVDAMHVDRDRLGDTQSHLSRLSAHHATVTDVVNLAERVFCTSIRNLVYSDRPCQVSARYAAVAGYFHPSGIEHAAWVVRAERV